MKTGLEPASRDRQVAAAFDEAARLHGRMRDTDPAPILAAIEAVITAFAGGGKVLVFGNGGSAADAQHFVADLVGRFGRERQPLAAVALTADTSVLTAVGNDYGFERLFSRQIEALGRPGDAAIGISTSGRSANVAGALARAGALGLTTIALTGARGGPVAEGAGIRITVPSDDTPRVQELHRTVLHVICQLVEDVVSSS